jgi:hypothetical protein
VLFVFHLEITDDLFVQEAKLHGFTGFVLEKGKDAALSKLLADERPVDDEDSEFTEDAEVIATIQNVQCL